MSNTKAVIAVLVHVALIVFVVFAIWPALKGGGTDRYHTKTAGVIVTQAAVEEVDEAAMTETADASMEEETVETAVEDVETPVEMEAVTEQVEVVEAAIEDVVDVVVVAEEKPAMEERVIEVAAVAVEENPAMAGGNVHIVTAQGLKYSPLVSVIAVGDTVAWEKMGSHDTQSLEGLVPEGSEMWHSSMGENYQRTFSQEGIYIYKCTPHWGAAMGGVIIVGKPVNHEAIKAATVKGAAKRLVKKALKAVAAM